MEITTKGQKISAMQWLSWRKEGMRTGEIADMLNITPSMARIIARKFRAAGYPDPFYKKTMPGPPIKLDTNTDTGSYILGILWGYYTGQSFKGVFNWLYQDAEIFNPNVREKMMDVLKNN